MDYINLFYSLEEKPIDDDISDDKNEIKELASSMKRKREQNKKAAARYRQKKKQM